MVGKEEGFVEDMRLFREWAVRIATLHHNPDWIMPVEDEEGGRCRFAFSLEAYNYFAEHSGRECKRFSCVEDLSSELEKHHVYLYRGESARMFRDSKFFMLPDKV